MKNIIWNKPDGSTAFTSIAHVSTDSAALAAQLKASGSIPADWTVSALDTPRAEEIDALPPPPDQAEIEAEQTAVAKRSLERIDLASIRLIREYIVSKADAPAELKELETTAAGERVKVKK